MSLLDWKSVVLTTALVVSAGVISSAGEPAPGGICGGQKSDYTGGQFAGGLEFQNDKVVKGSDVAGTWDLLKTERNAVVKWNLTAAYKPSQPPSATEFWSGEPWCEGTSTVVKDIKGYKVWRPIGPGASATNVEIFIVGRA